MHAFDFLRAGLDALPATEDPAADLVEVGLVFRRLATERPALYSIGVQRDGPSLPPWQPVCDAADAAFAVLSTRVARLGDAGCWASTPSPTPRSSSTRSAKDWPRSNYAACASRSTPSTSGEPRWHR